MHIFGQLHCFLGVGGYLGMRKAHQIKDLFVYIYDIIFIANLAFKHDFKKPLLVDGFNRRFYIDKQASSSQ